MTRKSKNKSEHFSKKSQVKSSQGRESSRKIENTRGTKNKGKTSHESVGWVDRSGKVHTLGGKPKREGRYEAIQEVSRKASHNSSHHSSKRAVSPKKESSFSIIKNKAPSNQFNRSAEAPLKRKNSQHSKPEFKSHIKLRATIDKNKKGFAFLVFRVKGMEDRFLDKRYAENFFHGDLVEVEFNTQGEIHNIQVIEHRFTSLVGKFKFASKGGWVVYERKKVQEKVYLAQVPAGIKEGHWVRVELKYEENKHIKVEGKVIEVYGEELPASADLAMVAGEYSLIEEHTQLAKDQAKKLTLEWDEKTRHDFRKVPFITIDGETARDFDDAVYVEKVKTGYILWVAIADVSHYVTKDTPLDEEAFSRGTSVYFPERAFHMLPRELSENLCSLRPHETRLTMVAKMHIDFKGVLHKTEVMDAVIESKRRATYTEIQKEYIQHGNSKVWEFTPHFELYKILRKARSNRGSVDFDLPEVKIIVDSNGEPQKVERQERHDSHRLIEEFMILANEAVTQWMLDQELPFIYRVHDEPSAEAILRFSKLAKNMGLQFKYKLETLHQDMSNFLLTLDGHPAQNLMNMSMLRSMKQAVYTATFGKHFGLASEGYTHFTSPIRRYPDLVVHRLLKMALHKKKFTPELEEELERIAEHCSHRERIASDADREAGKLKQVRMAMKFLGEERTGKVNGMVESGLFIQVEDPYLEGFLSVDNLKDDYYEFDDERMIMKGRRRNRIFKVGDAIQIRFARADIEQRLIDFDWIRTDKKKK